MFTERTDLLHVIWSDVPRLPVPVLQVNEFVKRVRAAKIHFLIMGQLRKQMPYFGQKSTQEKLLARLPEEFLHVQRENHLHPGVYCCTVILLKP